MTLSANIENYLTFEECSPANLEAFNHRKYGLGGWEEFEAKEKKCFNHLRSVHHEIWFQCDQ